MTNEIQTTTAAAAAGQVTEFIPFGAKDAIRLSINIVRNFIANPTKSGKLPDDRQCIKFNMLCKAKRLNPFDGDAFLIGYDGKDGPEFSQITAHQAFLKRAESNPEFDGMDSGVTVEAKYDPADPEPPNVIRVYGGKIVYERSGDMVFPDETLVGGWARVNFKTRSVPMLRRVSLATFNKGRSLWLSNPSGMIVKVAEADALRSSFPTLLGGLYIEQEVVREIEMERAPIQMPRAIKHEPVLAQAEEIEPERVPEEPPATARKPRGRPPAAKTDPAPAEPAFTMPVDPETVPLRDSGLFQDLLKNNEFKDRYFLSFDEAKQDGVPTDEAHETAYRAAIG